MHNPFDLAGRVAIVTGANTGIGQAIALALAAAGADIAAVGRSGCDETLAGVAAAGRQGRYIEADLGTIAPVEAVVAQTEQAFGRLDILVNNAGIIRRADALDYSEADWDAVIDTNLKSLFFLCQAAGRRMVAQGSGRIINIASLLSFQGGIRVPAYTAAKSGVAAPQRLDPVPHPRRALGQCFRYRWRGGVPSIGCSPIRPWPCARRRRGMARPLKSCHTTSCHTHFLLLTDGHTAASRPEPPEPTKKHNESGD
jgi:hypothetical protein